MKGEGEALPAEAQLSTWEDYAEVAKEQKGEQGERGSHVGTGRRRSRAPQSANRAGKKR